MYIKVSLLQRAISGNRIALYFSFWPPIIVPETGRSTRREFLQKYLVNKIMTETQPYKDEKGKAQKRIVPVLNKKGKPIIRELSDEDREYNEKVWEDALKSRTNRENELNKPEIYSSLERERLKAIETQKGSFLEYFKSLADTKNIKDKGVWYCVYKHLSEFTNNNLNFSDLNERFCEDFKVYLPTIKAYGGEVNISQNTAATYLIKFKIAINQAFKDKKISRNVGAGIKTIPTLESDRDFLTLEELNKLAKAFCFDVTIKRAALFSALTGLRKGDIQKLTWKEIELVDNKYKVKFRQQKTKEPQTLWISNQAFSLLGEPGESAKKVFPDLKLSSYYSKYLLGWVQAAGINKKITFHNFRHTFATLQLSQGTDVLTVSKMLGHKNLKTTQIYAKVIDRLKQDAADRIKLDL